MALMIKVKGVPPPLGSAYLLHRQGGAENRVSLIKCLRYDDEKRRRLRVEALKGVAPAAADDSHKRNVFAAADQCNSGDDDGGLPEAEQFKKDAFCLPKPLTAFEFSPPSDGSKMRVAYQGLAGSYNEEAALKAYPESKTVACDEYEAVFKAVELWSVDKAVLPIESSVTGSIHRNYDLLLRHKLHIVGEVNLQVNYCLLALPGVLKHDLKRVSSHPLALAQCQIMLTSLGVAKTGADDTASAAMCVASNGARDTGAIASSRAAKLYGLDILADGVQDDNDNVTRFLILAREPVIPGTKKIYKTSIAFILEEGSGVLFKALAVFSLRNISLTKIESRPLKECKAKFVDDSSSNGRKSANKCFDYLFYIDFKASMAETHAQNAMEHLQEFTRFLRVLGCYPMD